MGFELVDFRQRGSVQRPLLQVRIDRPGSSPGSGVTAQDCTTVSRSLERFLESGESVAPRYVLEVSSPGLERPVRFPEHWRRFVGREVKVKGPFKGNPTVTIVDVPDEDTVVLRFADDDERAIPREEIKDATLVVDWTAVTRPQGRKT